MATQLAEPVESAPEVPDNDVEAQSPAPRDFEGEAKKHGWTPKEEFKGDPSRWVDAETFVTRADEVMPLLKKKTEVQDRKIAELEKTVRQQAKLMSTADARAYERAVADLKAKKHEAVEAGDVRAVDAIDDQIDKLKADAKTATTTDEPQQYTKEEALEAYIDWRESNIWYDKGALASATEVEAAARTYADLMTDKHQAKTAEMSPGDFFEYIGGLVEAKYPALKQKAARQKPASDVSAPTNGRSNGSGRTYSDLPDDAKRSCDRLIRMGALPGKDDAEKRGYYAKNYDWS